MPRSDPESVDQTVSRKSVFAFLESGGGWLLYALPLSTVLVITFAVFVVGAERSYQAARLWGGPTEAMSHLSLRVQAVDRYYEVERALEKAPIVVEALNGLGTLARFEGTTDEAGFVEVSLRLPAPARGPVSLLVASGSQVLAEGGVSLARREWQKHARRRGGWVGGRQSSELRIRVRPGRGVFAVPFADSLWVEVTDGAGPVSGAAVKLEPEGFSLPARGTRLTTDVDGLVSSIFAPSEHVVTLRVEATHRERTAKWYSTLPVVPGAMHASLREGQLRIVSAVPREAAFFSVVDEAARLFGGRIALTPDGRGGAVAQVTLPKRVRRPFWAVVSSEPDMHSQAAVGWPMGFDAPVSTFDARDMLLLDGLPGAFEISRRRPGQARLLAAVYALLSFGLAVVLLMRRVRLADAKLRAHFQDQGFLDGGRFRLDRSWLRLLVAVLCLALGFVLIALITLARMG